MSPTHLRYRDAGPFLEAHASQFLALLVPEFTAVFPDADLRARKQKLDKESQADLRGQLSYLLRNKAFVRAAKQAGSTSIKPYRRENGFVRRSAEATFGPIVFGLVSHSIANGKVRPTQRHRTICRGTVNSWSQPELPGFEVDRSDEVIKSPERLLVLLSCKPSRYQPSKINEFQLHIMTEKGDDARPWLSMDVPQLVASFGAILPSADVLSIGESTTESEIVVPRPMAPIKPKRELES